MSETMLERVEAAIEKAARSCTPWGDSPFGLGDFDDDDVFHPRTLEDFVNATYIGEEGAREVFSAAAKAAARAVIEAMREPTEDMLENALEAKDNAIALARQSAKDRNDRIHVPAGRGRIAHETAEVGDWWLKPFWQAAIDTALTEKD